MKSQKNRIQISFILLLIMLNGFMTSCDMDEKEYNKETPDEALALTANSSDIVLNVANPNGDALSLKWTSGTNGGTNAAIDYTLEIDRVDGDFSQPLVQLNKGRRTYEQTYSNAALNDLLIGTLAATPGVAVGLKARIVAIVANDKANDQISEACTFNVTPYKPLPTALYMVGDATPGGWALDAATEMKVDNNVVGGFFVTAPMTVGEFKFVLQTDAFLPGYNMDGSSATPKLIYRGSDSDPDLPFTITEDAKYRIGVNLITMDITIAKQAGPRYEHIYFVGDFTGWSFIEMRQDPTDLFVFRYGAVLNGGGDRDFKFGTASGSWDNMLHPSIANAPYTHQETTWSGDGDNKWKLTPAENGKAYKIAVNITEGEEKMEMAEFVPSADVWMIGGATPTGWGLPGTKMTKGADDYTYTWTGKLIEGEIKFAAYDSPDWGKTGESTPWYMSTEDQLPVTPNAGMICTLSYRPSGDRKWKLSAADAGNYTVTLNQLTETVTFQKN